MKTDIIFTRPRLSFEEEYGHLAKVGSVEMPNGICVLAAVILSMFFNRKK